MGGQGLGHGFGQLRIDNSHVRGDVEVSERVFNALLIVGDDGESGYLAGGAGGGGDG